MYCGSYWKWDKIKITADSLTFENKKNKEPFLFGVSTSAYQVEGEDGVTQKPYNQWEKWASKEVEIEGKKCKPIEHKAGKACEHWKRYKEDIQSMKDLGFKAYRFSVSWGKIEPKEGEFNEKALQHYEDVCKELQKQGIKPMITLFYHTYPCWFEDKGAFEKEANIACFERFCVKVFERLKQYVHIWFPFNTFTAYAFTGYSEGVRPPFKKDLQLAVDVLKNTLEAHVTVYHKLKSIDKNATIGILKSIMHVDEYSKWNPLDLVASSQAEKLSKKCIYKFFKKGTFKVWLPTKANLKHINKKAIGAFDCIGLNYYSGVYISNFAMCARSELIPTQDELYTIYPEGLYRALEQLWSNWGKKFKVPIYVTENGVAAQKAEDRELFFKRHLYAVSKAIKDGIDVRGYMVWTLFDSFEWTDGYNVKNYGLYAVDRDMQKRTLKDGTQFLLDVVKKDNVVKKEILG